jgi:hypothetical protein
MTVWALCGYCGNRVENCDCQKQSSCAHDYGVEKGISFCLDCGQFEDYLEQTDREGGQNDNN